MASHYVAICFPLALGLISTSNKAWARGLAALCLVLAPVFLFYTKTHSAWLAVLVVILVTAVGVPRLLARAGSYTVRRTPLYAVLALLFGACLVGVLATEDVLESDGATAGRLASVSGADFGTADLRLIFWKNSLAMARDHPVFGVGLGNFELLYPRYHRAVEVDWTFDEEHQLERVHNDHLQMLAELGLIGLVVWIAIYVVAFRLVWSGLRSSMGWVPPQMLFVGLGVLAFLIVACFSFPMERAVPPAYVFALLGMIGFLHASGTDTTGEPRHFPPWVRRGGSLLLIAFLTVSVVNARTALLTNIHFTTGVRWTKEGEHERAITVLERARRLSPQDADVLLLLAGNHAESGRCDVAREMLRDVLRVHPLEITAIANLGYCSLQLQDYDAAERYLLQALEILPDSPQLHTNLGTVHFRKKRADLAIDAYRRAIELAMTKPFLPSARAESRIVQPRLLLAHVYVSRNRLDEAIEEYEEVLRLEPDRHDVRRILVELYGTVGEPNRADELPQAQP